MKKALIIGSTGLIGNLLTIKLLDSEYYTKVVVLTRKKLAINHPKLEQIVCNFDNLPADKIIADDIFCCLGTTMKKAGSKANFEKVDYEYPLKVAEIALKNQAKQYIIVTAMGANSQSLFYYNRVKGKIEQALSELSFQSLLIFRPSMLLGDRLEKRGGEQIGVQLIKALNFVIPKKYKGIEANKVANAMLILAQSNLAGVNIFESDSLQAY